MRSLRFIFHIKHLTCAVLVLGICACSGGYDGNDKKRLKGVTHEEIAPDEILHIDARGGARKHSLNFQTTGAREHGRYLSEYLLLVYNTDEEDGGQPCVRLRFRADASANYSDDERDFFSAGPGDACGPEQTGNDEEADDEERAALAQPLAVEPAYLNQPPHANLTQSKELCSISNFRVLAPRGGSNSSSNPRLEQIVEKTGRFLAISKDGLVRVWVDEEIFKGRNPCPYIGRAPNELEQLIFNRTTVGSQIGDQVSIWYDSDYQRPTDHLTQHHLQNIADETEKAYERLSVFGEVGDVDNSGTIEVFISPDINRRLAYGGTDARTIDEMTLLPFYRPFDIQPLDTQRNSLSNEGEIIYLWAPDPVGEYASHASSPGSSYVVSSNSLTTNYSKGFIGYQLMSLIIWNNKYVKHNLLEWERDNWVRNALSLLASSYIGGIDYSNNFINNYLFSRTQLVNLRLPETGEGITSDMRVLGMLTLFGWYLHARLCGPTPEICGKLKQLIDNQFVGNQNIAHVFDEDANDVFLNFGLSIATHVAERPQEIIELWSKKKHNFQIQQPVKMFTVDDESNTTEVKPIPQTVERAESELIELSTSFNAALESRGLFFAAPDCMANPTPDMCGQRNFYCIVGCRGTAPDFNTYFKTAPTTGLDDRTHAAPFLYEDMYNFWHVLMPDSELDFRTINNTAAAVLISGFTNNEMELLANIGRGLQLIVVPLGERDRNVRALYKEKGAEYAHLSTQPVNLTDVRPQDSIYEEVESPFEDMSNYQITPDRQLWIAGSNEIFSVAECSDNERCEGVATRTVNDSDAYGIMFDPCPENNPDVCENYNYRVIIQAKARDYQSSGNNDYIPFIIATSVSRDLFDGQTTLAYANSLGIPGDEDTVVCAAADKTGPDVGTCLDNETVYDPFDNPDEYHPVDNFFHSSLEYPILNYGTMLPPWRARQDGKQRLFLAEETLRQYHAFRLPPSTEWELNDLKFLPVDNPVGDNLFLSSELAYAGNEILFGLFKQEVCKGYAGTDDECPFADLDYNGVGDFETIARALVSLTPDMARQFTQSRYVCDVDDSDDSGDSDLIDQCPSDTVLENKVCPLFDRDSSLTSCNTDSARMLRYHQIDPDQNLPTYYESSILDWEMFEPMHREDSCFFVHDEHNPEDIEACRFDATNFTTATSILQQLDVESREVGCNAEPSYLESHDEQLNVVQEVVQGVLGGRVSKVCLGAMIEQGATATNNDDSDERLMLILRYFLQNHRHRLRRYTHMPGEIIASEGYIDVITFSIPYDRNIHDNRKSMINLIVGGFNDTEGKYLVRAKLIREKVR